MHWTPLMLGTEGWKQIFRASRVGNTSFQFSQTLHCREERDNVEMSELLNPGTCAQTSLPLKDQGAGVGVDSDCKYPVRCAACKWERSRQSVNQGLANCQKGKAWDTKKGCAKFASLRRYVFFQTLLVHSLESECVRQKIKTETTFPLVNITL